MTINPICTEFDAQLRRSGLSQSEFARRCGVTVKAVNNWCRGRQPVPSWAWLLARYAELLSLGELDDFPLFTWREVLGTWSKDHARRARGRLAKIYHPDVGGDAASMQRVNAAFDEAMKS